MKQKVSPAKDKAKQAEEIHFPRLCDVRGSMVLGNKVQLGKQRSQHRL